jgi:NTE family protein
MDGGTHSATNAELAKGYDTAVVLAVSGTAGDPEMAAQFRRQLDNELVILRESGTRVELVVPDASSIRAFGPSLMDPRNAASAAEAGLVQGNAEAATLRGIWGAATSASIPVARKRRGLVDAGGPGQFADRGLGAGK